jgi:hypothetical protein
MSEHTKEPWRLVRHEINGRLIRLEIYGPEGCGRGGHPIAVMPSGFTRLEEDARRIMACVNACAGWPTEKLEEVAAGWRDLVVTAKGEIG